MRSHPAFGRLWPLLNRKILDVAQLRLRFCSIFATKSVSKSGAIPKRLIYEQALSFRPERVLFRLGAVGPPRLAERRDLFCLLHDTAILAFNTTPLSILLLLILLILTLLQKSFNVIPAQAGIQVFQSPLDRGCHRSDGFVEFCKRLSCLQNRPPASYRLPPLSPGPLANSFGMQIFMESSMIQEDKNDQDCSIDREGFRRFRINPTCRSL